MDNLGRRVELFAAIELNCSDIYSLLIELCPDKSKLWNYLSKVEQNHATIAVLANRYCSLGKLPDSFVHPSLAEDDLKETLAATVDLKKQIENREISCEEAIRKTVELEDAPCKVYFRDFLDSNSDPDSDADADSDPDSEIISTLRQLVWDTHGHVDILKELVNRRNHY